jgi:RNase P protein component
MKPCSGSCGKSYPITQFWSDVGAPDGRMSRCPDCEKTARRERAEAKAKGEIEGVPDRNGRVVHFSEEERKRRSELAKRLHAEGRFGGAVIGANGGKAVRRHRITDAILEHFRQPDQQDLILRAYESNLRAKNKASRLRAAEALAKLENEAEKRMLAERTSPDLEAMPDDELANFVQGALEQMIARGEIPADVELGPDDVREIR